MKKIKPLVFWPPFLLLIGAVAFSMMNEEGFGVIINAVNNWMLKNIAWGFNMTGFLMVVLVVGLYFSPFAKVRIGGSQAKPLLTNWEWFCIVLCTTIAIGLLFWGAAEPIYHLTAPPVSLGIEPNSSAAVLFSMSTMYLHWTFTPYALYTIPALMFAFAYYNMLKPFSLSATLTPVLGDRVLGKWGHGIDAVCLYSLVAGMAASLATGILTISGGLESLYGIQSNPFTWTIVAAVIIVTFVLSAISGLMNGIRILSDINTKFFFGIIIFVFLFGPTAYVLNLGTESFGVYLSEFFKRNLFTGAAAGDPWPGWWTTFYWANWLAWAPVSALFLGRIGYGRTVKEFIRMNLFLPAIFGAVWITIFSGTAIFMQTHGIDLAGTLATGGAEAVGYMILKNLPFSGIVIPLFIFIAFISFVSGADANTSAMGGISSVGISPESPEPGTAIKVVWGITLGLVSWTMLNFAGIDGIKILSNLGGFPAMILELIVGVGLLKVSANPSKYDTFKGDYDTKGNYRENTPME